MADGKQPIPVLLDHSRDEVAAAIWRLRQSAYGVEANLLQVSSFPPLEKSPSDITSDASQYYGMEAAGELLGLAELESAEHDEGAITLASLLVEPALQRQGIGGSLLDFIQGLAWIRQINVETAALNQPALGLYSKMGFRQLSMRTSDDGFQLIRLQWLL